jgi:Na+/proline symporter
MEPRVQDSFGGWDWAVIVLYLGFTTWVGHAMRGKQGTIRDFFLGGRTIPWPAVTGSIIATEISALTFVGVPGTVFAAHGDFTYLQWALGSIVARFAVGYWLIPYYYEKEIYSPYDFLGNRLGHGIKQWVTGLFTVGAILGQSVRLLVTALILKVVTGMEIEWCILGIGVFSVVWTWMGGLRTVIWTDVIQFFLFVGGGLLALVWIVASLDGGWGTVARANREASVLEFVWEGTERTETVYRVQSGTGDVTEQVLVVRGDPKRGVPPVTGVVEAAGEGGKRQVRVGDVVVPAEARRRDKMRILEARVRDPKTNSYLIFTIWIALLAMPFQNFAAFGTDQLMAQRIFCCRGPAEARKAMTWSSVSQAITVLMLLVSAGLYAWYQQRAVTPDEFRLFTEDSNNVFPVWIVQVLPPGVSGLLIAAAFAAAISSLDSVLAALAQTTLSLMKGRHGLEGHDSGDSAGMVWQSRLLVAGWGLGLCAFAVFLNVLYEMGEKNMIDFAFRMVSYTYGPMLGILFLALAPVRSSSTGIMVGTLVSVGLAAAVLPDVANAARVLGWEGARAPWKWPFPWLFPLNAAITFAFGWGFGALGAGTAGSGSGSGTPEQR